MTAAVGLYVRLGLPEPWKPTTTPTPLIIYGGSGAVVCPLFSDFDHDLTVI
jgi:NADPH2:quinone reductase